MPGTKERIDINQILQSSDGSIERARAWLCVSVLGSKRSLNGVKRTAALEAKADIGRLRFLQSGAEVVPLNAPSAQFAQAQQAGRDLAHRPRAVLAIRQSRPIRPAR